MRTLFLLLLCCLLLSGVVRANSFPLILYDGAGRQVTLAQPARRVVALSRGGLEIVIALGGNVVGQPSLRGMALPEAMQSLPVVGHVVTPNLEVLMQTAPDLIIAPAQAHGDVAERLKVLQTPLYLSHVQSVTDALRTIRDIGALLDAEPQAAALCAALERQLAEARAVIPPGDQPRTLLLFGTAQSFSVITPHAFAGDLLRLAGGENVAATIMRRQISAPGTEMEYVPLSLEDLLQVEPEVIAVVSHGDPELVTTALNNELGIHPAWRTLSAVRQGRVRVLPAELLSSDVGAEFPKALRLLIEVVHGR
jgi:iron complex transport system substrate-binding protein